VAANKPKILNRIAKIGYGYVCRRLILALINYIFRNCTDTTQITSKLDLQNFSWSYHVLLLYFYGCSQSRQI